MAATLNINTDEVVRLTNKLEKLKRSDLPLAVRGTLNDSAFMARKEGMKNFQSNFIIRVPNFIRSHMVVEKVPNTWDIDKMSAEMGIKKGKTKAGDRLGILERGGNLSGRDVPTASARSGETNRGLVNKAYYQKLWKNRTKGTIYKSGESRIIKSDKGLFRVLRGGIWKTLYFFGKSVKIDEKPFIEPAGLEAEKSLVNLFIQNAKKRIDKYWK